MQSEPEFATDFMHPGIKTAGSQSDEIYVLSDKYIYCYLPFVPMLLQRQSAVVFLQV